MGGEHRAGSHRRAATSARSRPGAPADVLILDDRLELRAVFVRGKERVAA